MQEFSANEFKGKFLPMKSQFRLKMPLHEAKYPWLRILLDCYAIIDYSVHKAIQGFDKKIACSKECSACCKHHIPISAIESAGLRFCVNELLDKDVLRTMVDKSKLRQDMCLFRMNEGCAVYDLRPIACRRFLVASKRCGMDEDVLNERYGDVIEPGREYLYSAIKRTLPFYVAQGMVLRDKEHIFDFHIRHSVELSSIYSKIMEAVP